MGMQIGYLLVGLGSGFGFGSGLVWSASRLVTALQQGPNRGPIEQSIMDEVGFR